MPIIKFGQIKFGEDRFGARFKGGAYYRRTKLGSYIGGWIRGQIAKQLIFRVRPGNGYYNSIVGVLYQDKLPYHIPWPNGNPACATARSALTTAMLNWSGFTDEQQAPYIEQAKKEGLPHGYNVYVREYVSENA